MAFVDAGRGAWWASLPRTLSGRGAVMMGHIAEASPKHASQWRMFLTEVFFDHVGEWWNSLGDDPVERILGI